MKETLKIFAEAIFGTVLATIFAIVALPAAIISILLVAALGIVTIPLEIIRNILKRK